MTSDDVTLRLDAAVRIAKRAGETALSYFNNRDALTIETKTSAQDLVSEADKTVETEIRNAVKAAFPDDALLGEEHGLEPGSSGYVWVIDPIDGTSPFLNGLTSWCVSVAVAKGETPVIGVIEAPALGETYVAAKGHGATVNGRKMWISEDTRLDSANVGVGSPSLPDEEGVRHGQFIGKLMSEGGIYYRNGSGAVMLAYVAAGRLAGYFDPSINAWDCFAGIVLIEEAGGQVVFEGAAQPVTRGPIRAGAPAVVEALGRIAAAV